MKNNLSGKPAECRRILGDSSSSDEIINASILFQEREYAQASSQLMKWGNKNAKTELALIKAAAMFLQVTFFSFLQSKNKSQISILI